ncbi:MAG TPA: PQQ-dependent sugar dehydrogenase [Acetobacteraceae bacterium]|nr:PQQ-dependent sugar dehydrogenase [Acetobacteraceae bacterium]
MRGVAALPLLLLAAATAGAPYGDWHDDAPGVVRHFAPDAMPPPYATSSAAHAPSVVARPVGAILHVPRGFVVDEFASGLERPRTLRVAPNGDVFLAESGAARIRVFRAPDGAARPAQSSIFADGLSQPFGIGFWPPGPDPRYVYVALSGQVVRLPYRSGDLRARGAAEVVVANLPRGVHWTRDLVFSRDGRTMFVSVGSASNIGTTGEEERADVLAFDADGGNRRIFASGLRNCSAEAIAPVTNALWCVVNERDGLGDDLPPDYATSVREGAFYGWPWYYIGDHEDPRLKGQRRDLGGHVTLPDVLIQPHSAPLGIAFYDGTQFPPEYRGDAFVTLHGSWNRARRTGYKVIRLRFADGRPTGEYEDFLTGFVASDQAVWARPVGIAMARDGSLLVSEDGNGTIWRIAYRGDGF